MRGIRADFVRDIDRHRYRARVGISSNFISWTNNLDSDRTRCYDTDNLAAIEADEITWISLIIIRSLRSHGLLGLLTSVDFMINRQGKCEAPPGNSATANSGYHDLL